MPTHQVFVICSKYPKCKGPGVAEYRDDPNEKDGYLRHHTVEEQSCGFCSVDNSEEGRVPMRMASEKEIEEYFQRNPQRRPVPEVSKGESE